jgi:large repetitive protein
MAAEHTAGRVRTYGRKVVALALFALVLVTALALAGSSKASVESPAPPQVWSDKADYAPGELVTLSGANWAPGEAVHIRVNDDAGQTWSRDVDVTAADDGTISDQFNLPTSFVALYTVTATGAQSGTASWSFTDGNVKARSSASGITYTLNFREHADTETCGGATSASGTNLATGFSGGATFSRGVAKADSIELVAAATSDQGGVFLGWSGETSSDTFNLTGYTPPDARTICVPGDFTGNRTYVATYGAKPVVTAPANQTANEGASTSFSLGSFTDADNNGPWTVDVDWGDSSPHTTFSKTTTGSLGSQNHTYADNGSYTVAVKVTDATSLSDTKTFTATVSNLPPTGTLGNNGPKDEGSAVSISFTGVSDPSSVDATSLHYAFDCAGGSLTAVTYAGAGTSSSTSCTFNDNGSYTVSGVIIDKDGGRFDATTTVTVNNVAPSVTVTGTSPVDEGGPYAYSYSWTDPGSDDTFPVAGNSVSCGPKGTASDKVFTPASKTGSFKCTFSDDSGAGTFAVSATVTDDDGGVGTGTKQVTVANVAPQVNLTGPDTADEGDTKTYSYTITDAGTDDTFSFVTGYPTCGLHGDLVGTPLIGDGNFQCSFPDGPNTTDVKIKVQDDDGGVSTADTEHVEIIQVAIANVAPTVTAASNQSSDEGELKSFSLGSFSDPGTDSPWAVDVNWGDSSTHTTFDETATGAASGQTITAKTHTYDDNGVYTVTVKVTDKNGAFDSKTFTVTVANVAPTATFSNTGPVNEGSSFTLSLTDPHDPSGADTTAGFEYRFDCGDGSGYGAYGASNSTSCSTTDNGIRSVKGQIKDKDGGNTAYTGSVTVNNVAPTVTAATGQSSDEGESHSFSLGSFSDPGSDSPWAVDVDWGDTSAHTTFNETFAGPAVSHLITAKSHKYDDNDTYTVTVKVTDKDGGNDSKTFQVTVANVPPTGTLGSNSPINEGGSATVLFSAVSDPSVSDSGTLHYAFDCNGGSLAAVTYSTSTATNSKSCSYDDGPSDHTVTGVIIDDDGGRHDDTTSVHVNNVAPSATFNSPASVNEGSSFTLSLTSSSDPSTADAGAGFTYAFDCGSGTYGAFGASNLTSCPTNDNGTRAVRGKIKDKDNGEREYTANVTVNNVAPTAIFSDNGPVNEGSSFTLSLTSPNDPSTADTSAGFTYAFDCGSGTYGAYGASNTTSCPTTDDGTRAVRGKIKDKDGGYTAYNGSVTVTNVPPDITNVTASNTFAGPLVFMTSTISTFFTDPGSGDTWTNLLTFSDGGTETGTSPTAQGGDEYKFTLTHTFAAPGCKTVMSKVTDDDLGSDTFGPTTVNVGTGEFLPPMTNTKVTNKLKNGQVLPVKIKLTNCNGVAITNLSPTIIMKEGDLTTGAPDDLVQPITVDSVSGADTTGVMRSVDSSYIYNMRVNVAKLNQDYTIIIYPFGLGDTSQSIRHVIQATK